VSTEPGPTDRPADEDRRREVWARYWSTGALHSCATSYAGDYAGAIGAFWRGVFSTLQPGQRVLDLATGNGALPHLLLHCRPQADVECDAVDLSPVAPAWVASLPAPQLERIRFHGQTRAEALPFGDGCFDLVVSQYGFEYCRLDEAATELQRVLAPGGAVAMILHHAGSRPVALAHDELAHIDWLGQPGGLLESTALLLEPMARAATEAGRQSLAHDTGAIAARERFNRWQRELSQRAAVAPCPDVLHEVREALAQVLAAATRQGEAQARLRLAHVHRHLADSALRLRELCACALDAARIEALATRLARPGSSVGRAQVVEGVAVMGWSLQLTPHLAPR
jgi:SAM-dependent methyltransferase